MRILAGGLGLVAALVVLVLVIGGSAPPSRPAPALPRQALTGVPTTLAALRGRPAVVDFFASWCGPCVAEAPTIARAQRALRGRATLVAVDWSDSRRYALQFIHRFGWSFPVLADPNGSSGYAYGIQGLPSAFVLNAQGRIVRRLLGPQTLEGVLSAVRQAT